MYSFCTTETLYPLTNTSPFPLPSAPGNHHSTLCFYELGDLDSTYKWDPAVFVPLRLAEFPWHSVLPVHPCCRKWQAFLLFKEGKGWIIFPCVCVPHFLYPFVLQWALRFCCTLAIVGTAVMGGQMTTEILFLFPLDMDLEAQLLEPVATPIHFPTNSAQGCLFSTSWPALPFVFLLTAILTGVRG